MAQKEEIHLRAYAPFVPVRGKKDVHFFRYRLSKNNGTDIFFGDRFTAVLTIHLR